MLSSLHFVNAWHSTSGGIRTFYLALLDAAERDGRPLAIVAPGPKTRVERLGQYTRVYTIEAPPSLAFDRRYRVLYPHRYLVRRASPLWRIIEEERPSLVEICDKYALCHLAGLIKARAENGPRPTLVGLGTERMDDNVSAWIARGRAGARFSGWYLRRVYLPQFDFHIAVSDYVADELRAVIEKHSVTDWRLRRLRAAVHVLPMGVDVERFRPARRANEVRRALLARAGGDASSALLVYAGRLSPEKQVQWLPEILGSLLARGQDARLAIIGGGPGRSELLASLRERAPGRFVLLDHCTNRDELASHIASADVFVHPNPREPFGIGPLEAMAAGVPVVLARAGGVLSYASNVNAWLADPSPGQLAGAISALLLNPSLAKARARAAIDTAASLTWPLVARRFLHLYEQLHAQRLAASYVLEEGSAATANSARPILRRSPGFRSARETR
jgi:glycosyltransferase involved in cell wall biosynthesis